MTFELIATEEYCQLLCSILNNHPKYKPPSMDRGQRWSVVDVYPWQRRWTDPPTAGLKSLFVVRPAR